MEGNVARKYGSDEWKSSSGPEIAPESREREALSRYTVSFGLSLAITSIFSALLVVVKELNETTILAWMKHATPHHWITHGIIDLVLFAVLGFALSRANGGRGLDVSAGKLVATITGAVIAGCVVISAFYLFIG